MKESVAVFLDTSGVAADGSAKDRTLILLSGQVAKEAVRDGKEAKALQAARRAGPLPDMPHQPSGPEDRRPTPRRE